MVHRETSADSDPFDLERFVLAQRDAYPRALAELQAGRKRSHWMWYIFPQMRGDAEVVAFYHHLDGAVYVTADLTGKPNASFADYELMICHRSAQDWGPNVISRLAPYTQEAYIDAGESMDIDQATPADSKIKAFLFDTYATFTLFGQENGLACASASRSRSWNSRWRTGRRSCWRS